jgi:CheY-like chemotaxis protein
MAEPRQLLAFGSFTATEYSRLAHIAQDSAFAIHVEGDAQDASAWLDSHQADAMVLHVAPETAEAFTIERRAESKHAFVPVFSWSEQVTDLGFAEAFSWGADDLVGSSADMALRTRLRQVPKDPGAPAEVTRGKALVADPDRVRRIVVGRVLRNAGYSVTFATTLPDLKEYLDAPELQMVIATSAILDSPRSIIEHSREGGKTPAWIVSTPPRDIRTCREVLAGLSRVTTTDAFAPAENVLFVSNEMSRQRDVDNRATPRLLYGTMAAYRGRGRDTDDYGYTYNISEGGLYVRTLAPPDDDLVWLELCPPRADRRVRLVGRVAWRRGIGRSQFATVPPGFGVEIVDGAKMDLSAWIEGYRSFRGLVG